MIDLTKPVQTRDGREVEMYNKERMHGAVRLSNGIWHCLSWQKDGSTALELDRSYDLVNVSPEMIKVRMYVSIWGDVGWRADTLPLGKICLDGEEIIAFNFPVDIEIPKGFGV